MIKSVLNIGDEIEATVHGIKGIFTVYDIKVILNSPIIRPIDLVINISLKYDGDRMISCTSKYILIDKFISQEKEANGNKLD